jgi:hypothetical protein
LRKGGTEAGARLRTVFSGGLKGAEGCLLQRGAIISLKLKPKPEDPWDGGNARRKLLIFR